MKIRATGILICIIAFMAATYQNSGELIYPEYFPETVYSFENNPLTTNKIELGRKLFYDPILSKDNSISCASCHSPYNAFAHTDHDLSHGIHDQIGTRNAPALFNLAWQKSFMWDGAINHLDMQALAPISDSTEMGESIENVANKLQKSSSYPALFLNAFGDSTVTGQHILQAFSQFQLTLVSANSKYDQVQMGATTFSEQELNGYKIFQENCNACHTEPLFSNFEFANNGLSLDTTLNDFGRQLITRSPSDTGLFKTPSLRNLSFTFPYMHDGRFDKISQVVNHYTQLNTESRNLSEPLKKPITLTGNEKTDLTAFLLTLNDTAFVFDPKHQFPKKFN